MLRESRRLAVLLVAVGASLLFACQEDPKKEEEKPAPKVEKPAPACTVSPEAPKPVATDPDPKPAPGALSGPIKGNKVTIGPGNYTVTGDLVVVALGALNVLGNMTPVRATGDSLPSITLISLTDVVTIGGGATVGNGVGTAGLAGAAGANGKTGQHGGMITILAPQKSVIVDGKVMGSKAGDGGADAKGVVGASATAVSGEGGRGGDVLICALEKITGNGAVTGGAGGKSGKATADAVLKDNVPANATTRDGGRGGEITFSGYGPAAVPVSVKGVNQAGNAGDAELAAASNGRQFGSTATGGKGGIGGNIEFILAAPQNGALQYVAGNGARGGNATAAGRAAPPQVAPPAKASGKNGGNAVADAGDGGKPGKVINGAGTAGKAGSGADASATSGNAGTALGAGVGIAHGSTGKLSAHGGDNGAGGKAPAAVTDGPNKSAAVPPAGPPAFGKTMTQKGIP